MSMQQDKSGREPAAAPSKLTGEARNVDQAHLLLLVIALIILMTVGGFVVLLPTFRPANNMLKQPYYRPYEPSEMFADTMSERPLVSGVVPRPAQNSPGIPYVAVRQSGPAGYPVLAQSANIPVPITEELLQRGQERFNIYCAVCHGELGTGDGMIVRRGFYSPPSFHIPRLRQAPDAHFFNVITNGYGTMFSYAERVAPADRWAIVAYIRALQAGVAESPTLSREFQKPAGVRP